MYALESASRVSPKKSTNPRSLFFFLSFLLLLFLSCLENVGSDVIQHGHEVRQDAQVHAQHFGLARQAREDLLDGKLGFDGRLFLRRRKRLGRLARLPHRPWKKKKKKRRRKEDVNGTKGKKEKKKKKKRRCQ